MNNLCHYIFVAILAFVLVQTVNADTTLLADSFTVDANVSNPNYEITNGRQTGTQATSQYTYNGNVQVGHSYVAFGQPVGYTNVMLLAQGSWAYNNLALNDSLLNGGSLKISFGLYASYSGASSGDWMSFAIGNNFGSGNGPWPAGGGQSQFGIIVHQNGALDIEESGTDLFSRGRVMSPPTRGRSFSAARAELILRSMAPRRSASMMATP